MGGRPVCALNIVGFPEANLEPIVLGDILRGAADKAREAGIDIVGGHTIRSDEPIFGLAVVGTIHPEHVLTNARARPGDALILTKPIGVGIITTAAKQDVDRLGAIKGAIQTMATLNRTAAEVLTTTGVHALTDITGFGLLGHLRNIVAASGVTAHVWYDHVPVIEAAVTYLKEGIAPGGTHANWRFLSGDWVDWGADVTKEEQLLLCDAQTSGGLLASVKAVDAETLLEALHSAGVADARVIGRVVEPSSGRIVVRRSES